MEKKLRGSSRIAGAIGLAAMTLLAACGGGGGDGGGGSSGPVPQGTVKMSMTDAPSCYRNVWVNVEKVRIHKNGTTADTQAGWEEIIPPNAPVRIDLLNLTNGALADLGTATVDAGAYRQIRLVLADNGNEVILLDGTPQQLKTPSAQQSGLKIQADFDVAANSTTEMLLDFDACKSIVIAGNSGQYVLKPVVRFTDQPAGSITGYVTTTLTLGKTAVSAQQGGEVLRSTVPDANGQFRLAYLQPGTYTVVITSDERATGVINSVPVGTATTAVNGTASYIVLPTSSMTTVTGTVTASAVAVTDATVTAFQNVATGGPIQVLSVPVDLDFATYTMRLPTADPVRAPYSASGLAFAADATAAGKYDLKAVSPTKGTKSVVFDARGAATTANIAY
ncbi:MAG TPA: DUF4382 domain-containing protein [Ramlibacter sp.]|uniref:DUF4382 domain-containing protein n=1 Tax=Ramlibacter sp. TaxID=1917967 RepID=UPI002ED2A964